MDFIGREQVVVFSVQDSFTRKCANFTIIDDNVPELTEEFVIIVNSSLPEVEFQTSNFVTVFITDEDRKCY